MLDNIVEIRHQLHQHPDVSGCEQFAHDCIVEQLHRLSPTTIYDHVGGYGVVAYWKSNENENQNVCPSYSPLHSPITPPFTPQSLQSCLAFRADIDALPIGHRCGHDGHTAIMLRFAEIVDSTPNRKHDILLIFQPEEETGKGAAKIVASGIMQRHNVKAVFGLHNLPGYKACEVVLNRRTFAAASSGVIYKLVGRPTHASTPEKGLNPGRAAAAIINRMDTLNRNNGDMRQFRQSTLICCRVGEEAFGTSAGCGEVMFTLRAFTNDTMLALMQDADAIAQEEAKRWNLEFEKQLREPFLATENTTELVDKLEVLFNADGIPVTVREEPFRWSEDFAEYLKEFPGVFFGIGSGESQPELHHPQYDFPDQIIEPAAHCFQLIMNSD